MQKEETCYLCDSRADLVTGTRDTTAGSRRIPFEDEYYQCSNCGEKFYTGDMADESFRRGAAAVRREDGLLAPDEIREIRALYGISQASLERLIKSGEKTVVRWSAAPWRRTRPPTPCCVCSVTIPRWWRGWRASAG